jgi:hypothetical protein
MDEINNYFETLSLNDKKCVICQNYYIRNYDYIHNDVLCCICSKNYQELIYGLDESFDNSLI